MNQYYSSWAKDLEFKNIYDSFGKLAGQQENIEDPWFGRLYILRQLALQQSNKNKKFIECGVYAGQSMYFVADLCNNEFIGIDSFEGVSDPGEFDTDYFKTTKLELDISYAQHRLQDKKNIKLVKGWIPNIFTVLEKDEYSYIHIDLDLYKPTKSAIEYLWPQLVIGGVLICDDYGSEKTIGAKKAMNDYFGKNNLLELPTGQAVIFKNE